MGWFIDGQSQREIEQALGRPLPPPTSEEFRILMQDLATEQPDLRRRILEALSASPVELPSERHERRLARQARLRRLLFGWLRRETFAGDVVWDKRRILASSFGAAAVLLVAMFAVNQAAWQPPAARDPQTLPEEAAPPPPRRDVSPAPARPAHQVAPDAPPRAQPPLSAAALPFASLPAAPMTRTAPAAPVSPPSRLTAPPFVLPEVPLPIWPAPAAAADPQPASSSTRLIIQETPETAQPSRTLIVYQAQQTAAVLGSNPAPQGAIVHDRDGQIAALPTVPPDPALRPGQVAAARLVTALALVQGAGAVPVVAASDGPALTWLGEATLGADGLVQVTFHTAIGERAALAVRAVALDAATHRPGLEAQVKTVARHTAAAVVGAALRSTQDYVQALVAQRQVTITNGWATITTGEVPPLWMLLSSRLAELLAPRAQEASRPIQVAEVSAGAQFAILVLQTGGGR